MKIIIVHASAGAGHFKAAQAIYNYFKEHCPQFDIRLVDILEKSDYFFRISYSRGYLFLICHAVILWKLSFWVTKARPLRRLTRPIARILNQLNTKEFSNYLISEQADYIISTHFLPPEIAASLKNKQKINSKLITVITDFGVHPYWLSSPIDTYVVASDYTRQQLISEGVREAKIRVLGIPVDVKFLKAEDKNTLCAKFNILADKFTILISTGSFGIGPIEEIVRLIHHDAQVLVVCARNQSLKLRLEQKAYTNVKVFGFVENMSELMAVADLMITKPGGLTIAEILVRELVPVFICPIPGQEMENAKALEYFGASLSVNSPNDIKSIILDFKEHPRKIEELKSRIRKISKPRALGDLCDVVCKNSTGPCC
jgi:processive 1,2-diacylglycerol beta-glucosyltransferase